MSKTGHVDTLMVKKFILTKSKNDHNAERPLLYYLSETNIYLTESRVPKEEVSGASEF